MFGGGAIAGLINFISKEPTENSEATLTLNHSTLTETNINGYFAQRKNSFGYTLFAGFTNQNAVDVDGDNFSDVPFNRSLQLHPQLFFFINDSTKLRVGLTASFEDRIGGDMKAIKNNITISNIFQSLSHYFHSKYFEQNTTSYNAADVVYSHILENKKEFSFKSSINYFHRQSKTNFSSFDGKQWNGYSEIYELIPSGNHSFMFGGNYLLDNF